MKTLLATIVAVGSLLSGAASATAAPLIFQVTVNTAPLVGSASGPFALDFQLIDGSGLSNGNNTATISNFSFTGAGAGATGSATLAGGASGSLASTVSLTDSSFLNELFQGFTAGSSLSFRVTLTTNVEAGPTPDAFSFAVLDRNLLNIPTNGLGDALLVVDIRSATLGLSDVRTFGSTSPAGVSVTVSAAAVPEPVTLLLLGTGVIAVGVRRMRRV
jgi:PEP-CTERM motif